MFSLIATSMNCWKTLRLNATLSPVSLTQITLLSVLQHISKLNSLFWFELEPGTYLYKNASPIYQTKLKFYANHHGQRGPS